MNLLGAYVPGSSLLHRLDPAVRIVAFSLIFSALIAASGSAAGYVLGCLVLILLYRAGGIPVRPVIRAMIRFRAFFITVFLMNAFFQPSPEPIFSCWIVTFSVHGIKAGLRMVLSVVLLSALASLLTAVATPVGITDGLRTVLHPLSLLRIPVDEASFIISVAIGLIPVLAAESEAILLSGEARGAIPGGRRLRDRALSVVPLALPVFLAAFRRVDELALAMEARGYAGEKGRRRNTRIHFGRDEAAALIVSVLIAAGAAALEGVKAI